MCIAIMKSANKKINKATLKRCYDANPDGAGFMYADNMKTSKYYYTFVLKHTVQLIKRIATHFLLISLLALFIMASSLVTVIAKSQIL